jgi:hypothetical protein
LEQLFLFAQYIGMGNKTPIFCDEGAQSRPELPVIRFVAFCRRPGIGGRRACAARMPTFPMDALRLYKANAAQHLFLHSAT